MFENRFEALETKLLYQEDAIQKLDDALISQQKLISDLQLQVKSLMSQIKTMESQSPDINTGPELPPHY